MTVFCWKEFLAENSFQQSIKQDLSDITDKNCLRNVFSDFYNNLTDIYNRNIIVINLLKVVETSMISLGCQPH